MEADDGEGGATQEEFSNIDREALPCLQVLLGIIRKVKAGWGLVLVLLAGG